MPHTPAPWHIDLESPFTLGGDSRSVDALTPDGTMVTREIACLLFDTDEWPDGEGWLEDCANARLIAAAPDLLAALEQIVKDLESVNERDPVPDEINEDSHWAAARAAIAKAKGIAV